jgi:hypothetical protein
MHGEVMQMERTVRQRVFRGVGGHRCTFPPSRAAAAAAVASGSGTRQLLRGHAGLQGLQRRVEGGGCDGDGEGLRD